MGSTLIMIIIGMVVIAVLGVGVYTLSMTAAFNQAEAQKAAKAYYISESCIRIAASEYKAATNKNSKLVELNGKTFTMPNNQGSCMVEIYPYWFYAPTATTYSIGATSITLYLPGAVPPVEQDGTTKISLLNIPANVNVKIKKKGSSPEEYSFSNAAFGSFNNPNGTMATFTLKTPLTNQVVIAAGDEFYLGCHYTSTSAAPYEGQDLILNIHPDDTNDLTAKMFPPEKGSIFIDNGNISQYSYDKREIVTTSTPHTVRLTKIQAISEPYTPTWPVTINNTPIYMGKSLGIRSDANYGD